MRRALPYVVSGGALLALVGVALVVGRYPVSPADLLSGKVSTTVETVLWQVRGPRVLAALLVGAALAAAGSAYQGMFRNPLVSPDILGVSTGAALGAVLGIFFSQGMFDENELRRQDVITIEDAEGNIMAFLNIIPSNAEEECTYDLIRIVSGAFPFRPALHGLEAGLTGTDLGVQLLHLVALTLAYGFIGRLALRRLA